MFDLHPQLARDTRPIGDLPLSRLLLMNDSTYPWCILVPRRSGITEIHQLSFVEQQQLTCESVQLAIAMEELFSADKLNIAALGNLVPQLHIHHVVRYRKDPAWPKPVWGQLPAKPYTPENAEQIIAAITGRLPELQPL